MLEWLRILLARRAVLAAAGTVDENAAWVEAILRRLEAARDQGYADSGRARENVAIPTAAPDVLSRMNEAALAGLAMRLLDRRRQRFLAGRGRRGNMRQARIWARQRLEMAFFESRRERARFGCAPDRAAAAARALSRLCRAHGLDAFLVEESLREVMLHGGFAGPQRVVHMGVGGQTAGLAEVARLLRDAPDFSTPLKVEDAFLQVRHADGVLLRVHVLHEDEKRGLAYFHPRHGWRQYHSVPDGMEEKQTSHGPLPLPGQAEAWLRESFGDWRAGSLLWDPFLDNPNLVPEASTEMRGALRWCELFEKALDDGDEARVEWALQRLRDDFGIDFTAHLPVSGVRTNVRLPLLSSERWRRRDRRASVLVAGVFDDLDEELVRLLRQARKRGQFVILGVLGDALAERMTGVRPRSVLALRMASLSLFKQGDTSLPIIEEAALHDIMKEYACGTILLEKSLEEGGGVP